MGLLRGAVRRDGVCDVQPPPARRLGKGAEILCHRTEDELLDAQTSVEPTAPLLSALH